MADGANNMYIDSCWENCYKALIWQALEDDLALPEKKGQVWCCGGVSNDVSDEWCRSLRALFERFRAERSSEEVKEVSGCLLNLSYLISWL